MSKISEIVENHERVKDDTFIRTFARRILAEVKAEVEGRKVEISEIISRGRDVDLGRNAALSDVSAWLDQEIKNI